MKKILVSLLALSVLASCGGNSSQNSGNVKSGSKAKQSVIKASALISKAEAAALLEQSMEDRESEKKYFIDESHYVSKDFNFSIALWQEALHDKSSDFEKGLLKNGWAA